MKGNRKGNAGEREKELLYVPFCEEQWTEIRVKDRDGGRWEARERKRGEGRGR
jgi:hypothetical protein